MRGEFVIYEPHKFSHAIQDDELESLKRMGMVSDFDQMTVYLTSMPEDPLHHKPEA